MEIVAPPTEHITKKFSRKGKRSQRGLSEYLHNANQILPLSVDVHSSHRDDQIRRIASLLCPFLLDSNDSGSEDEHVVTTNKKGYTFSAGESRSLTVKPLLGGTSNELFIVSTRQEPSVSVLVRIQPGSNDSGPSGNGVAVINEEIENQFAAWLSEQSVAPTYYGRFQNGRVEEFYENVTPLSHTEMVPYGPLIAQAMADFHSLKTPGHVLPKSENATSCRLDSVEEWMRAIQGSPSADPTFVQILSDEWKWLRPQLEKLPSVSSPVQAQALEFIREIVVTHMDCQSLNVLKDSNGAIHVIDFEYAGWNCRAMDIANTFCEHCDMNNLRADYEREYPSIFVQNTFLKAYLNVADPKMSAQLTKSGDWSEFLATLRSEIGRWTLLSHLGWTAWSIIKVSAGQTIDFDYMEYAKHRMDGYALGKARFFPMC